MEEPKTVDELYDKLDKYLLVSSNVNFGDFDEIMAMADEIKMTHKTQIATLTKRSEVTELALKCVIKNICGDDEGKYRKMYATSLEIASQMWENEHE